MFSQIKRIFLRRKTRRNEKQLENAINYEFNLITRSDSNNECDLATAGVV